MHVHEQVADARRKVVQVSPGQREDDELDEPLRSETVQVFVGRFGRETAFEQVEREGKQEDKAYV